MKKIYSDKYIVITGGAGFIGSCLIQQLNDQGIDNIIVVDELGKENKWTNLLGKRFLDLLHKDQLFSWLEGREREISTFFHLGACSSTTEGDADFLLENNTRYSIRLAEYALRAGHRFIYASSAATYGNGSNGFSDDPSILDSLRPENMYGFSKHLFDLWLYRQNLLDKVVGLKFFNVYGPNEFHKGSMASAIIKMFHDAKKSRKIFLFQSSDPRYADGEQKRDFIYIKDAVKMTAQFLTNEEFGIFNIGSGKASSWNELATAVFKALEMEGEIIYVPMPEILMGKYQNFTQADQSKSIRQALAMPRYSLEEGVNEYVREYLVKKKHW